MKKILLLVIGLLLLTGCKAEYIITYEDGYFKEELAVDSVSIEDENEFNDAVDAQKNYDDSFTHTQENGKEVFKSNSNSLDSLKLLYSCFQKVYTLDEDKYISIITDGDNLCTGNDIKVTFKSDMKIITSNGTKIDNNTVKWDNLDKGISIQVSKTKKVENKNALAKETSTRMILFVLFVIIVIVVGIVLFIMNKKSNKKEISF